GVNVTGVLRGSSQTFAVGDEIRIQLQLSEAVVVAGTLSYAIRLDSGIRVAHYDAASSTATQLSFRYTFVAGDNNPSGIVNILPNALTVGGTVRDLAGNNMIFPNAWGWSYDNSDNAFAGGTYTFALSGATSNQAENLIRSLGYRNESVSPTLQSRNFYISVLDANGGTSLKLLSAIDLIRPSAPQIALLNDGGTVINLVQATSGLLSVRATSTDIASASVSFTGLQGGVTKAIPFLIANTSQNVTLTSSDLLKLGDGAVTVRVVAIDTAGNTSEASTTNFTLNTSLPIGQVKMALPLLTAWTNFVDGAATTLVSATNLHAENIVLIGGTSLSNGISAGLKPTWLKSTVMQNAWISSNYDNNQTKINVIWLRDVADRVGVVEYYRVALTANTQISNATLQTLNFGDFGSAVLPSNSWSATDPQNYQYADVTVVQIANTLVLSNDNGMLATDGISNNGQIKVLLLNTAATDAWQYSINAGATWTNGSAAVNGQSSLVLPAGIYTSGTVQVRVVNSVGNAGVTTSNNSLITIDQTPPTATSLFASFDINLLAVSTSQAQAGAVSVIAESGTQVTISFSRASGVNTVTKILSANGSAQNVVLTASEVAQLGTGSITVTAFATDIAGNIGPSGTLNLNLSANALPRVATSLALDSGINNDGITNNATINVGGLQSGVTWQYQLDGNASWTNGTGTSFTATNGAHTYAVHQISSSGSTGGSSTRMVYVLDTVVDAPSISLASDTGASSSDGNTSNPTIDVKGLESGAAWQYQVDGGVWSDGIAGGSSFLGVSGTHTYKTRQIDLAGNTSTASTATIYIINNTVPPILSLVSDTGVSQTDRITTNRTIKVSGLEATSTWQYQIDGASFING
ncbi:MAG: hypothetical protein ORN21_02715, partial [Methylophilaceae bacterium]|nr:hypothetical protein [Methylophilaceae bacterium]